MPSVSVIVPNFNHERYLRQRIHSILAQTYEDFELILLDDCSTDQSRDLLASYANNPKVTRTEFNAENSGSTFKQWNKGVQMASGRYIWFAESDDFADRHFLARMVAILEEQPNATFAYCQSVKVQEEGRHLASTDPYVTRFGRDHWDRDFVVEGLEECRRFFVLSAPVANASAVVLRRDVYERVGRADENLSVCSDYKLWAQMAMQGKIAYLAQPLNYFRSHVENVRYRSRRLALDVAEFFYVMLWIVNQFAAGDEDTTMREEVLKQVPRSLSPSQRIESAKRSLSLVAKWNLRNNHNVPKAILEANFAEWEFALAGRQFEIVPPNRLDFFFHRYRFFRKNIRRADPLGSVVNFMRMIGAPVVGYRHRHWPGEVYTCVTRKLEQALGKRDSRGPSLEP
jgi:glycosyltransferase involved in cell wall biosynthesis